MAQGTFKGSMAGRQHKQTRSIRRLRVWLTLATAISAAAPLMIGPGLLQARAATSTIVSLTFDNDTYSEYTLGYQQALQPKAVKATFYITSGNIGHSTTLSWAQLSTLAAAGDEIGGKTVDNVNLTTLTAQAQINEICNDRQAIIQHGITPFSFAYPGGAGYTNTTIESEVQNCGYSNARSASSPTIAETLPPSNWLALHAFAPGGQLTLSYLEGLVTNAASHSGGWVPIVMQKVCSSTLDNANYTTCTASSGWVDLGDLNTFLSWVQNAGLSGGAPSGAAFKNIAAAAASADTVPPMTAISCNGAPCQSTTYSGTVTVALMATDLGSGVASTHYTTDGTTPALTSPIYSGPFSLTGTATVQYRSWDNAGSVEAMHTQVVQVQPQSPDTTPPTTTISCNSAACTTAGYTAPATVALTATDNVGGWGVDKTYYTTDGSTPTTSSTVYTGPFTLKQTSTVKFFSTDLAGNVEQVESQTVLFSIVVSLTFDDGDLSQYSVGFLHGLQPHNMHATFYNVSGYTNVNAGAMTWTQLTNLYNNGDEIGGHTVDHIDMTSSSYTLQQKTNEVCNDRQTLIQHGLDPGSFAYPFGAYNATAEQIVQGCGYASARGTGGLDTAGPGAGPVYAETMPPNVPYALRTEYNYLVGAPLTLAYLQSAVTAASQNGGGWVPIVLHEICSQTYDPADYNTCTATYGPAELSIFNSFLDWLQNAGQPNGAPFGTIIKTVRQVMAGPDVTAPLTTISCDGAPCQTSTYNGSTTVALTATDAGGSGMKATYYTTDGSTPTTSSPVYTSPWTIAQNTTVKFFSVDNAGNVEAVHSQQILVAPNSDPVVGSAGDIACDPASPSFNNGFGTATDCRAIHTEPLLTGIDAVLPLGDDQYDCGGYSAFLQSYDQSWGPKLAITRPVPGDKDYATTGTGCPTTPGAGYYQYFGSRAGDPSKGYYSYNLGSWHMIAINTGPCGVTPSFCAPGSAQDLWLQNDLATSATMCTLAYYQNPRFTSTPGGGDATYQQIWQDLYKGGADVVLNGDSHWYERFAPVNASGVADPTYGVQEFIVGTGGAPLDTPSTPLPTSQVLSNTTHGIIKMTLHNGSYSWSFVNDGESSFTDSGSANCHTAPPGPDVTPPTTTATCNGLACGTGWYNAAVQVALTATDNTGGSGVAATYYTTNGSTPTTSSTIYTAPFTVSSTATVKFFSTDKVGNTEAFKSQAIQIDTVPPTTTISCNSTSCQASYALPVQVGLSATENAGGSGVATTYYTTDGSDPTISSTATVYSAPFTVSQTESLKFYSKDVAGNAEVVNTQAIQITVDTTAPTTSITCNSAVCSTGWYKNSPVTVTLAATDNNGGSGVAATYYTTDGSTPTTSSTAYTAPFTVSQTASVKFFSVDNAGNAEAVQTQPIQIDTVAPTTLISCNSTACSTGAYASAVQVALSATDNAGGSGVATTYYTTDGSAPTTSSTVYTAPFTVSNTATVKFFSVDNAGNAETVNSQTIQIQAPDTTPPTTTIACNGAACSSGWYNAAPMTVALTATDNTGGSAVFATYYTTNGSTPTTSSPVYTVPFTVSATTTVKFFSVDNAGNAEAVNSQTIQIDTVAPTTLITCNSTACSTSAYSSVVTVALTGTDNSGGSGVAATYYTTDGSTPTTSSAVYAVPFTVSNTTTVKFFSVDNASNAETVNTQSIQVQAPDTTPPTTSIACNGAACASGWYNAAPMTVALTATDNTGGSAVFATYYTTNGSTPTTSSTVYTVPFTVSATTTVKFFSVDNAGNAEAVNSQVIQIDTVAPTTLISCNGTACSTGSYASAVTVTLTATDNTGGSGVAATYYTTNGSTPTTSSTVYTAPFTLSNSATVKFFSVDNAGNTEAVNSQSIQIQLPDTTPPTTSIACNSTACSTGWYKTSPVPVALTATDNTGGSGVAATYYTIDGSTPTTSSPVYTGSFTVPATTTVEFFSVDNAGNSEAVNSQTIQIDTVAPTTLISCNGTACSTGSYASAVTVTLTATDNTGGSGVASTYYTTNGSTPTTSSPVYTGSFTVSVTSTVKFFSVDSAGNAEAVNSQTVQIQVPDTTPPTTSIACNSTACSTGWYKTSLVTVALTATDNTGGSGVAATYYTIDGSTPTTSSPVYTGSFTVPATTIVKFFSVDNAGNSEAVNSQTIQIDTVAPTTLISCNGTACSTGAYASAVTVTLTATDNTGGSGVASTYYTTNGSSPTTSSPVYIGPFTVPTTTTVKFFSLDSAGNAEAVNSQAIQIQVPDTTPPTTSIACNSAACSTGWYKTSSVTVTLTATDNTGGSGVAATYYTIDGSTPTTSSPVYTGSFTVSATTTVKFFSVDNAGNTEVVNSQAIQIDTVAPTTLISCSSTSCSTGWYKTTPVTVALTPTDNTGGSGVSATYYTTNGSTPTTSSTVYAGPFTVSATSTVKFFSVDNAGNAEAVNSQAIQIDTIAPTTTISCNGAVCSTGWYNAAATVTLTATDNSGGSGVNATYYTTNGSTPTTSSTIYTGTFTVSATTTVKFFSVDNAGNAEAVKSQVIQIDTVAPTTTISCNNTTCSTGWYKTAPVAVRLAATDNGGGSGLNATYYTTNGSTPTTSSTVYTGSFNVSATTTVKFFSVDNAGNGEAVKSQTIQIDTVAPTTAISCDSATCSTGWYKTTPVTVALTGVDNTGGSGVAATYYTTDGSTPTTSSTVYTGPFAVSATTTIKFFSVDVAGNKEAVKSQNIKIDAAPPVVSITSPASGSSFALGTKVTVTASASDVGTGSGAASGIASVAFYLNGTTLLATHTTSPYSFSWNTNKLTRGTYSLTAVATDKAGNSTTSAIVTVTIT